MSQLYQDLPPRQAIGQIWKGIVARAPLGWDSPIGVILPDMHPGLIWDQVRWQPRDNMSLPEIGDECLVILDNNREPWVVTWQPDPRNAMIETSPYVGGPPVNPVDEDIWIASDANDYGASYMYQYDADNSQWDQISSSGDTGTVYRGTWRWTTSTSAAAASSIGINTAAWSTATRVNIAKMSGANVDSTNVLNAVRINDYIYIQDNTDATKFGRYKVTSLAVDAGAYVYYNVVLDSNGLGGLPANNRDCLVLLTRPSSPQTGVSDPWHIVGTTGEPGYQNGWVAYGPPTYPDARFRKLPSGLVVVSGLVKNGTIAGPPTGTIFTLPVGYRPGAILHIPVVTTETFAYSHVSTDGQITAGGPPSAPKNWWSLDSIRFPAEQ